MEAKNSKKCKTCIYRHSASSFICCDYLVIEGHKRGCGVEDCNKYKKGKKLKRISRIDLNDNDTYENWNDIPIAEV